MHFASIRLCLALLFIISINLISWRKEIKERKKGNTGPCRFVYCLWRGGFLLDQWAPAAPLELKSSLSFVSARAFNAHAHLAPHAWRRLATVLKTHTTQSTEPLTLSRPARTETLSSTSFKQAACLSFSAAGGTALLPPQPPTPPPSLTAACAPAPTAALHHGRTIAAASAATQRRMCPATHYCHTAFGGLQSKTSEKLQLLFLILILLDPVPTLHKTWCVENFFSLHIVNVAILKIIVASINYFAILFCCCCISPWLKTNYEILFRPGCLFFRLRQQQKWNKYVWYLIIGFSVFS